MFTKDPIQQVEKLVRETHDSVGKFTQPAVKRYPLLFAFFLTFSVAAIIHGFDIVIDEVEVFHSHPFLLIGIGALALFLTGTLYKLLEKNRG
jgi:hypothetical protein